MHIVANSSTQPLSSHIDPRTVRVDPYRARISGVDPLAGQRREDLTEHDRARYDEYIERDVATGEQIAREEMRKNELAQASFQTAQQQGVHEAARNIKKPSLLLYGNWIFWAFLIWIFNIILIFFADAGGASDFIKIPFEAILFISSWMAARQIKNIHDHADTIDASVAHAQQRIQGYRTKYARAIKTLRKSGKAGRAVARSVVRLVNRVKDSPAFRSLAANIADIIPLLDLLPFSVYAVYTTHKAHKEAFKASLISIQQHQAAMAEEQAEFSQDQIVEYETTLAEIGEEAEEELAEAA